MSVSTSIGFVNATAPKFVAAIATPEGRAAWEDEHGPVEWCPGEYTSDYSIPNDKSPVTETDEEYGGWIIDLSKLPPGTTHIRVSQG